MVYSSRLNFRMITIKQGSKGPEVKTLQQKLNLAVDGIFGLVTDEAVRNFQKSKGLTADGIVGNKTWAALGVAGQTKRLINEIVIHCSATPEGRDFSVAQIKTCHLARGFNDIGYHYVIYRDGSIHAGRSEALVGAHAPGHNTNSIGICYIGGYAADGKTCKDTRTPAQKAALVSLIKTLIAKYPTIKKIIGHRDTSPDLNHNGLIEPFEYIKGCPCFDAIPEYQNLIK